MCNQKPLRFKSERFLIFLRVSPVKDEPPQRSENYGFACVASFLWKKTKFYHQRKKDEDEFSENLSRDNR